MRPFSKSCAGPTEISRSNFDGKTTEQSTKLNTQGLLMEGLRLLDEAQRDASGRPKKMSSSTTEPFTAAVLTVSDSCARREKQDLSGPAVAEAIRKFNFGVAARDVVPDEQTEIQQKLIAL